MVKPKRKKHHSWNLPNDLSTLITSEADAAAATLSAEAYRSSAGIFA
jgi:hypothetical protein